jgi:cyclohexanone monooxygenase
MGRLGGQTEGVTAAPSSPPSEIDVVVVGAGFAGMYMLHKLRGLGLSAVVIEAGTDVGGTWYWNRYPGARCDVPSMEYSFSFDRELEQEWEWTELMAGQPEILDYARHVAERFDLRKDIVFETRVTAADFDEVTNRWTVSADTGSQWTSRFCVMATGCLSIPNTPDLAGLDSFAGELLHTGFWPKDEPNLDGKRVGVIGTGSSGVQSIPELAERAEHLHVFQRSPVYTVPANNKPLRPEIVAEFKERYDEIRERQRQSVSGFLGPLALKKKKQLPDGVPGTANKGPRRGLLDRSLPKLP